jgi:hypothetical protein
MTNDRRELYRMLRRVKRNLRMTNDLVREAKDGLRKARELRQIALDGVREVKEWIRDMEISESANRED